MPCRWLVAPNAFNRITRFPVVARGYPGGRLIHSSPAFPASVRSVAVRLFYGQNSRVSMIATHT